jgi:opine dehydrogenase
VFVTVVGGGNGGHAAAGALALAGHRVRLHDIDDTKVAPVASAGGIDVAGPVVEGFAPVDYAGTDLGQAMDGAELVMVIVPGAAQGDAVEALAPHLAEGASVLLHPGCTGGALECARILRDAGKDVLVGETDSFLYAGRFPQPGKTFIGAVKAQLRVGVLPADGRDRFVAHVQEVFPAAEAASSVLETSLGNMNAMLHVGPMLANAGRIEHPDTTFEFYGEGITPGVARLVEQVDEERMALCGALDVPGRTIRAWIADTYGVTGSSLYDTIQTLNRDVYKTSPAPTTLAHRYLTEDVGEGFVPLEALGHAAGVSMQLTGALVSVASAALGRDFRREGRTAERMGIAGLDAGGIRGLLAERSYLGADQ